MAAGTANRIHPTAILGPEVELGQGNTIGPYVVISGPVRIGDDNFFSPHVSIGAAADVRGHHLDPGWEEPTRDSGVVIGSRNVFKEFSSVTQGWAHETRVGDDAFLMGKAHVSHDCTLGNGVTLAHTAVLAGHVTVGDGANLGLGTVVHQRAWIGAGAMVGMQSAVRADLPPYAVSLGVPARPTRLNTYRLDLLGVAAADHDAIAAVALGGGRDLDRVPDHARSALAQWVERRDGAAPARAE
ncbi:UDP-N-acetylglucosamine acyltransferase [Nocardioides houyundeii]|uniref:UDP-N-acetylglucosamine acyltransferase n=1 Tax=Nocardioides houyundeii TaxID=2045452 RepID=UPI000DF220DD|nr:UDP-N-acetylglucosamine acyltransferase [Nocardioides houyundeii]